VRHLRAVSGGFRLGTTLTIRVPSDFVLRRDCCSYGYFLLAPHRWDPEAETFSTAMDLGEAGAVRLRVTQPPARGATPGRGFTPRTLKGRDLKVRADRPLDRSAQRVVRARLTRMLRLDEDAACIRAFHRVDPRWRGSGRGRVFRSGTLFEDVVRTVTSCNVQWPSTVVMNERLCAVLGREGAFPPPRKLKRARASTLRARCRVGYRDRRLLDLADLFERGAIDEAWLTDPSVEDAAVFEWLCELPGIGPYAAANIMQLLGRYARLPMDTETVRHARTVLGMEGSDRELMARVEEHFAPFGDQAFRSYWFELWSFYESRRGPSWTWHRETTGKSFTASQLRAPGPSNE